MAIPHTRISASSGVNIPHLLERSQSRFHKAEEYEGGSTIESIKQHGCFNWISAPATLYHSYKNVQRAWHRRDLEGGIDHAINLFAVPLLAFNGVGVMYELLRTFNILKILLPAALTLMISVTGAAISGLEFVKQAMIYTVVDGFKNKILRDPFEMLMLAREKKGEDRTEQLKHILQFFEEQKDEYEKVVGKETFDDFHNAFTHQVNTLIDAGEHDIAIEKMLDHLLVISLSYIKERFFCVTPEELTKIEADMRSWHSNCTEEELAVHIENQIHNTLLGKKQMLSRRLNAPLVEELDKKIDTVLLDLHTATQETAQTAKDNAIDLFQKIKVRIDKNQIVLIVALIGLGTLIGGLLLFSHVSMPVLIPVLLIGGSTLLTADLFLERGWKHSDTWEFRPQDIPYSWMKNVARTVHSFFTEDKSSPVSEEARLQPPQEVFKDQEVVPYSPPAKVIQFPRMTHEKWKRSHKRIQAYI